MVATCAAFRGCAKLDTPVAASSGRPMAALSAVRPLANVRPTRRGVHVRCSVAGDVSTSPSTSGRGSSGDGTSSTTPPSSWPSAAARAAAYGATTRTPAVNMPATITGRLPEWLTGTYIRNGPGDFTPVEHMFDGYGMLSKFEIDGKANTATVSHRFLESEAWKHYAATGKMRWREFATAPRYESLVERLSDMANTVLGTMGLSQGVTDNASVNVVPMQDGSAVAMTETVQGTYRVDPATLQTLGQVRYRDGVKGDLTTAHPQPMPNGDLINVVSTVGVGFNVYRHPAGAFDRRESIATVPHRRPLSPAWVHDFPATQDYAVIPEMPLYFNVGALMLGGTSDYVFMDWVPSDGTTLHVVDLRTGSRRSFRAPPFFIFHWANAFESEDGRYLHVDACVYDDPQIVNDLYLGSLRGDYEEGKKAGQGFLRRITIDLQAPDGSTLPGWQPLVADEATASPPFDFPKTSPAVRCKPYRYVWGACSTRPTNAHNSLAKFDTHEKTVQVWHEPGTLVGEPVFVPAPHATAEDEGVVMAVLTQADGTAALSVLDGTTLQEVARASVPIKLTVGFHGCFIPA